MQRSYAATGASLLLAILLLNAYPQGSTHSPMNLSAAINSTKSYLNAINESSYLVFYPNLAKAYSQLYMAVNQSFSNSTMAFILLNESRNTASAELSRINGYRSESAYALAAIAIALAAALYMLMRPYNGAAVSARGRRTRRKSE